MAASPRAVVATPALGDIGGFLGAQYAELRRVAKQFQPSQEAIRLLLREVDPNWQRRSDDAFVIELLLQPNVLQVLPAWLSFQPKVVTTDELINTIIDLDDVRLVRLLVDYQRRMGVTGRRLDSELQARLIPRRASAALRNVLYMSSIANITMYYYGVVREPFFDHNDTSELDLLLHLYTQGLETPFRLLEWYENMASGRVNAAEIALPSILRAHTLAYKPLDREVERATAIRLPHVVWSFLLDHIDANDDQRWYLLEYAIGTTSPLYYNEWIEKYGDVTANVLAQRVRSALQRARFGDWASTYQPEIVLAKRMTESNPV